MSGDVDVSLRVASQSLSQEWARAGVMIRATLETGAPYAATLITAGHGYAFQRRLASGTTTTYTNGNAGAAPGWVRIRRTGSLFTAYRSSDGQTWTAIASASVSMNDQVYVGIAVSSFPTTPAAAVVADSFTVTEVAPVNQPPAVSLTAPASGATFTAPAAIALAANASDPENQLSRVEFYSGTMLIGTDTAAPYSFTWPGVPAGTYSLTAVAYDAGGLSAQSGAVAVTVTAPNQPPAVSLTAPANGATYTAPATIAIAANAADPENQLTKVEFYSGATLLGTDTTAPYTFTWAGVPAGTYSLQAVAYDAGGLTGTTASVVVTVTTAPGPLPAGQQAADIGAPAIAGTTSYSSGVYQISAGGGDIWVMADRFHYVYQQVSGDMDVSLRVASQSLSHEWARAGVMIRATLETGAPYAATLITAGHGYAFQRRLASGTTTTYTNGNAGAAPGWVRIKRTGSLFTAYRSSDGQTWTAIASDSVSMNNQVYVGIAVSSYSTTVPAAVVADSFTVTEVAPVNQPPAVSLTAPANGATFTAPATIALAASASDPENQLNRVEFYSGTTLLGIDTTAPYAFSWSSVAAGTYSLKAVAYDEGGLSAQSAAVTVTVGTPVQPPTGVIFQASVDHTIVVSYQVDVFAAGADPETATPIATINVGKPAPGAGNDITVTIPAFFSALPPGTYQLTVATQNADGLSRSAPPVTFVR